MKSLLVSLAAFAVTSVAHACPGAYVTVNDASFLSAEGIFGSEALERSTAQMEDQIKNGRRANYKLANKSGEKTHVVEFVGSVGDKEGIIQVVYVLKDLKTNVEKTLVLKSNYMGNGMRARGVDPMDGDLKKRQGFETLVEAGCN